MNDRLARFLSAMSLLLAACALWVAFASRNRTAVQPPREAPPSSEAEKPSLLPGSDAERAPPPAPEDEPHVDEGHRAAPQAEEGASEEPAGERMARLEADLQRLQAVFSRVEKSFTVRRDPARPDRIEEVPAEDGLTEEVIYTTIPLDDFDPGIEEVLEVLYRSEGEWFHVSPEDWEVTGRVLHIKVAEYDDGEFTERDLLRVICR